MFLVIGAGRGRAAGSRPQSRPWQRRSSSSPRASSCTTSCSGTGRCPSLGRNNAPGSSPRSSGDHRPWGTGSPTTSPFSRAEQCGCPCSASVATVATAPDPMGADDARGQPEGLQAANFHRRIRGQHCPFATRAGLQRAILKTPPGISAFFGVGAKPTQIPTDPCRAPATGATTETPDTPPGYSCFSRRRCGSRTAARGRPACSPLGP